MSIWFLYSGALIFVSVISHPLVQHIQPYPLTNYQQNVYQPPHSEAYFVQPSSINYYSSPHTIQTPLTYQVLQMPSLTEQLSQIYWDKLMSDPSLRKILDPNNIVYDQYSKNAQKSSQPYNTGGVVNNYIIIPSDYFKNNETVAKQQKRKRERNKLAKQKESHVTESVKPNQRKKKLSNNKVDSKDVTSSSNKKTKKAKHNTELSWNFNTDNIKCFTPADVLENEKYQPENNRKEALKKGHKPNRNRNLNSTTECKNNNRSQKSRKPKKSKVKNKSNNNVDNKIKEKKENIVPLTTPYKDTKDRKKQLNTCICPSEEVLPDNESSKVIQDIAQFCEVDKNNLLLSNLLQQDCTNLENRQTRNSKTDTVVKDFRQMYPDLPDDISKSLTKYITDVFSPHSLQQAPTSDLFLGNKYPFDLTQIYQIPQYPNGDVSKSKGNTEKNKNTRRKKKKKKNSKTKTRKENVNNNDETNRSQNIRKSIRIPKTSTQALDSSNQTSETTTVAPEKSTNKNIKRTMKATLITNESSTSKIDTISENIETKLTPSIVKVAEQSNRSIQNSEEIIGNKGLDMICDQNIKSKDGLKEIIETQIPYSVSVHTNNESSTEISSQNDGMIDEIGQEILNHIFERGPEDSIFDILLNYPDYYPDFKADNHAYLFSDEEIDVRNIHDRYFYVTDKNIDSREIYSSEQESPYYNQRRIYNEDETENMSTDQEDKSQEIVFITPPGLEVPDFVTRKINRDRRDSNEIYYQHEIEDDFARFNLDSFADKSDNVVRATKRTNDDDAGHFVETVYARSKVVKYGLGQELNKPLLLETKVQFPKDVAVEIDGDKTVVIAKSLRPEEDW